MLTIESNLFKLGMKYKDNDETFILTSIENRKHNDNSFDIKLGFRRLVKQECSNCGYVDITINPYCSKCFLNYSIPNTDLEEYGLNI